MNGSERTGIDAAERGDLTNLARGGGEEYPDERTMDDQPGLSGGEYPGAEEQTGVMSETLTPSGEATTFGGELGDYGPKGTMGSIDEGNAE